MTDRTVHVVHWGNEKLSGLERRARWLIKQQIEAGPATAYVLARKLSKDALARIGGIDKPYCYGSRAPRAWPRRLQERKHVKVIRRLDATDVIFWGWKSARGLAGALHADSASRRLILVEPGDANSGAATKNAGAYEAVLRRCDRVVCNSQAMRRGLALAWGYEGDVRVCRNPVDPGLAPSRARDRGGRSETVLGLAGRLVDRKGLPLALAALTRLRERGLAARLEVAGSGAREAEYKELAHSLGVREATTFRGRTCDMQAFYDGIDILLVPSLMDSFPSVILEASLRGCPVIGSSVDGIPEAIASGVTGYVLEPREDIDRYPAYGGRLDGVPRWVYAPTRDAIERPRLVHPDDLADAVEVLITDPKRYNDISRAAIDFVSRNFSLDRHIRDFFEAIGR